MNYELVVLIVIKIVCGVAVAYGQFVILIEVVVKRVHNLCLHQARHIALGFPALCDDSQLLPFANYIIYHLTGVTYMNGVIGDPCFYFRYSRGTDNENLCNN